MSTAQNASSGSSSKDSAALSGRTLVILAILGALTAMWAVFQWGELIVARMGGTPFCSVDGTIDCAKVWDSAFASAVHRMTGVPIAGWGVAWGLVAFLAPLLALAKKSEGDERAMMAPWSATVLAAVAGVATVVVMIVASYAAGALCLSCVGTYILVSAYAAVAYSGWRSHTVRVWQNGFVMVLVVAGLSYLMLLVPGMRTPSATSAREQIDAMANAANAAVKETTGADQHGPDDGHGHGSAGAGGSPALADFLGRLPKPMLQNISDSLGIYKAAPKVPVRMPRALAGSIDAPVRITDFTDVMCGHCAELHETLTELKRSLPPGLVAVESRQYPLDSECNPSMSSPPRYPVRCLAAKAQICIERREGAFEFSGKLFANQSGLTPADVYRLAEPYMPKAELQACVKSNETVAYLQDDITWATQHELEGTPLVLINGRKGTAFGPFLFALALAGMRLDDPAFASLPPPNRHAHIH